MSKTKKEILTELDEIANQVAKEHNARIMGIDKLVLVSIKTIQAIYDSQDTITKLTIVLVVLTIVITILTVESVFPGSIKVFTDSILNIAKK